MATTTIKWNVGEGNIVATYSGSGNAPISITSDANEGIDREQEINVSTTQGSNPQSVGVLVRQEGSREIFNASDGEFILADGGTFNVLKYELQ